MEQEKALVVFQDKKIRRIWHSNEWFFSVVDIVAALTDSPTPRQYWGKVKDREFIDIQLSPIWVQLKLPASDGKSYDTDCANTQSMFRIIQSILGEASTTKIARNKNAQEFNQNKEAAKEGGLVSGIARKELEQRSGEKIANKENYLTNPEKQKRINYNSRK